MGSHAVNPMQILSDAWHTLRLSVQHPSRVRTWDAIVLTAASPDQAKIYEVQLERAKQNGVIAGGTIVLAVPDPEGKRIGSGAATLHALRSLSDFVAKSTGKEVGMDESVSGMHVLLLHTGGDSKRVPWANCIGKAFVPLPFLADEDPDAPVLTLFDHILAISALALQAFSGKGGLLIMTGDVLPCFNALGFALPADGVCVVTVPCALDLASKHGVIHSASWKKGSAPPFRSSSGLGGNLNRGLFMVDDLLQKPNAQEMFKRGAVNKSRKVLLDTGIFALQGSAWRDLIGLANAHPNPVDEVLSDGTEVSLYEEVAGAWVSARHAWLQDRPLGKILIDGLGAHQLHTYCSYELKFLHFGTSGEVLDHLAVNFGGAVGRRHFSSIAGAAECEVASTAVILASVVSGGVSIGDESLVFDCTLGEGVHIGARCVVMGIHTKQIGTAGLSESSLHLPSWHCLWEVPLKGKKNNRVTLCCSIDDNPKAPYLGGGTFCRRPWAVLMSDLGIVEDDLWPSSSKDSQDLWSAKLFPVSNLGMGITFALWLMGCLAKDLVASWRDSARVSFAELHSQMDFDLFQTEVSIHRAELAAGFARTSICTGSMGRNLAKLSLAISSLGSNGLEVCKGLLALCKSSKMGQVPASRACQAQLDLSKACGEESCSEALDTSIWQSVALETERAVGRQHLGTGRTASPVLPSVRYAKVELPVRVDFMGGWSDTPPWSLERIGRVLNMAITLDGSLVVGAEVNVNDSRVISLTDDSGNEETITDLAIVSFPLSADDPFRLIKAALSVLGLSHHTSHMGLQIRTWANVPRGSGLGTSSILAVAVMKGLLTVIGGDLHEKNVANLVLLVEQVMGTGGGWQDQIGGLYPGIKCTTSYPGRPLTLHVESVDLSGHLVAELEERLVLVFTGQVRLAHQVLEKVVRRYLQRDARLVLSIRRLAELARIGQETLAVGDLERFGALLCEAWKLNQELDPMCSNPFVDDLFKQVAHLSCGYKLVGAGGGGFAIILAHNRYTSGQIKDIMSEVGDPVKVYDWKICSEM